MRKIRPKHGLGQVLIRSFQRSKVLGKLPKVKTQVSRKSKSAEKITRLSLRLISQSLTQPNRADSVSKKSQVPKPQLETGLLPQKAIQETSIIVQSHPEPAAQLELSIPSSENLAIATQELLRPNDRLKQSIEGFLLDQRSPHTKRAYQKDLKRFVQFLHSRSLGTGIEKLNRTVVIAYKDSLISEGLEHTTVDRHLATLRSFFKWLVDDGILTKSPAEGVRFLNPKRVSRTIGFSDDEVKKLLSLPNLHSRTGSLHYAILMVLFYCGLRRSELCELRTVNLSTERNQRIFRLRGKGNAERVVVVVPPVWNALQHYFLITRRSFNEDNYLFLPIKNNRTGVLDKALDPSSIFYIVTKYAREAGISNRVSPHSCRATAISNARDHQVPDRAIQEFAGWASPDMITRYDKRKSAIEHSAGHAISYGAENRPIPEAPKAFGSGTKILNSNQGLGDENLVSPRTVALGTTVDVSVPQSESK